jgi:RimJ/RimL family protein N-acetyltransferase
MRLTIDELSLVTTNSIDNEILALTDDFENLQNLTETRRYPPGMPQEMIFRLEKEGRLIGELQLKSIRWFNRKAEISIFISKEFRDKKLGEKALRLLMDYAFNSLNFHRLEAEVLASNEAGKKLVERAGFVREGILREAKYVDGKYVDLIRYGLLKNDLK